MDRQRAAPPLLNLTLAPDLQDLVLLARSQPNTRISVSVAGQSYPVSGDPQGLFKLEQRLPEGRYDITVTATRFGTQTVLRRRLLIDRTAPLLSGLEISRAQGFAHITGRVQDLSGMVKVKAEVAGRVYTRTFPLPKGQSAVDERFVFLVPLPSPDAQIVLSASDAAGNLSLPQRLDGDVSHAAP